MDNPITHLFLYLLLLLLIPLLFLLRILRRRGQHLPPGSTGVLPLVGETLQLISAYKTDDPEPFIDERVKRFGPIFTSHVFGEKCVFSADPETNRFILQNEGKLFDISYPSSLCNLLGKDSLLLMRGSLHKRMHSLTMSFANSTIMRDHLLLDIDRRFRSHMASWPSHIVFLEEAKKLTFSTSMKQLLSFDPCEWTENLRKQYLLVMNGFFSIPLPFFNTTYCKAMKARTKVVDALTLVVRQRRKESERGEKKTDMLESLFEEDRLGHGRFSDDEIVDFIVALLVGGYETTSTTMTFCIKFLYETPLALAQLREEQDKLKAQKGESEMLTWSDYKSMPFTQCVINETLRLANIIGGIFRRATSDVQFGEYKIPKGSKVFASFRAVHLNEDHFEDARTFNPWRWQSENRAVCPPNSYTPFGGGPRICPGYELARVSMSVFLHHMVTQFNWTPTDDDKLCFFPTTRTQKGYPIRLERREVKQCK